MFSHLASAAGGGEPSAPSAQRRMSSRQAEEDARWKQSRDAEMNFSLLHNYTTNQNE
jgi:hypothetical protein